MISLLPQHPPYEEMAGAVCRSSHLPVAPSTACLVLAEVERGKAHISLCRSGPQLSICSKQWHLIKGDYKSVRKQLGLAVFSQWTLPRRAALGKWAHSCMRALRNCVNVTQVRAWPQGFHMLACPDSPKARWRCERRSLFPWCPFLL